MIVRCFFDRDVLFFFRHDREHQHVANIVGQRDDEILAVDAFQLGRQRGQRGEKALKHFVAHRRVA